MDTEQPGVDAARHFYARLFGWTLTDAVPTGVPGTYLIASLDGKDVAAIGPAEDDAPAQWNTYIAVDDADAAQEPCVGLAARSPCRPSTRVPAAGWRAASIRGAGGFGCGSRGDGWASSSPTRRQLELQRSAHRRRSGSHRVLFDWQFDDLGFATLIRRPGYGDHLGATVDPGIRERHEAISAPPCFADGIAWLAPSPSGRDHWHVSFTVASRDDSAATAEELGAVVLSSDDTEWTKSVLIRDPQGAELTLSQFTPPDP